MTKVADQWSGGAGYESYVGRWSRAVAREFVSWTGIEPEARVLDVGCGTGALTQAVVQIAEPSAVVGVDPSEGYVSHARTLNNDPRVSFAVADASELPFPDDSFDAAVSGLVLNFVPEPSRAVAESARVIHSNGIVAAYVWDYAGRMELMRYFWDAAVELDPEAQALDEGRRFPRCNPDGLSRLFADLADVETHAIVVPTPFRDFDDYWQPFLSGEAPAPGYAASLDEDRRAALRERIRERLPTAADGSIDLVARAWAVKARVP